MGNQVVMRGTAAAVLGLALVPLWWSLWTARADWVAKGGTRQSIRRAIAMVPGNWAYYRDWGEIVRAGAPAETEAALRQAVAVNPWYGPVRIELAEVAEDAGDLEEAEKSLIQASKLDRTSTPLILLAEFYFRGKQVGKFWGAARTALERAADPPGDLLEECVEFQKGDRIMPAGTIPDRPVVLRKFLAALLGAGKLEAAGTVARKLGSDKLGSDREDAAALDGYCDRVLDAGLVGEARSVCAGRGLGWKYASGGGLYFEKEKATLSGKQPEQCDVMWRRVVLQAGRRYRLRLRYRVRDADFEKREQGESGLVWTLTGAEGTGRLVKGGREWHEESFAFQATDIDKVGRLVLRYERVKGTVRFEGTAEITRIDLAAE